MIAYGLESQILDFLREHPGSTATQIDHAFDDSARVETAMLRLHTYGDVRRREGRYWAAG